MVNCSSNAMQLEPHYLWWYEWILSCFIEWLWDDFPKIFSLNILIDLSYFLRKSRHALYSPQFPLLLAVPFFKATIVLPSSSNKPLINFYIPPSLSTGYLKSQRRWSFIYFGVCCKKKWVCTPLHHSTKYISQYIAISIFGNRWLVFLRFKILDKNLDYAKDFFFIADSTIMRQLCCIFHDIRN